MSANLCKQGQNFKKILDCMWAKYHDFRSCAGREKCV